MKGPLTLLLMPPLDCSFNLERKRSHLILLHGALGCKEQLDPLKELLSDTFEVHSLSFEGHGGLPSENTFTMKGFAQNVLDYMEEYHISTAHFFGYSMGGYVALTLAMEYPEKAQNIATLGTKFDWTPETAQKEASLLNPDVIEVKVPHFAQRLASLHAPEDWKLLMHKIKAMMIDLGTGSRLSDSQLRSVSHKTHILLGSRDNMVTQEESQNTASLLSNGSFQLLDEVPHPIEKVDPHLLSETLLQLLS